jgi:predicted MFS family arabinose efflux permease
VVRDYRTIIAMDASEVPRREALTAVAVGFAALASAMGVGRFAFTPLFPLMQDSSGVTLAQGAWLASVNYLGYLLGAVMSFALPLPPRAAVRWGLLAVAASTVSMAFANALPLWLLLRLIAGVASAWVLVGASAWALPLLARHGQLRWSGWLYAGVGAGMCLAGLAALVVGAVGAAAGWAWIGLGAAAAGVTAVAWRPLATIGAAAAPPSSAGLGRLDVSGWTLVVCYGVFGFGYILPATFIPAMARAVVADPKVFAWAWPLFGFAAALSTITLAHLSRNPRPRTAAGLSLIVMAAGTCLPVLRGGLVALCVAAVLVGGTFMVATMTCMQEAHRIGGQAAGRLIGAMTAAFALGQLAGPLTVTASGPIGEAIARPAAAAAALLLLAGTVLLVQRAPISRPEGRDATDVQESAR